MGIHQETHPTYVEGCDICRYTSVSVAPSATPTRKGGQEAATVNARESRWARDMGAYRELRRQGMQPRQIDGSDRLAATASDRIEVEMGHVFKTKGQLAAAREGMVEAQQLRADSA